MLERFGKYKGIHPGVVLERELKKRSIKQRPFAQMLNEHPQTFNAITKGKRGLTIQLALKIEKELGLEEGSLVMLQAFYDIRRIKDKEVIATPNLEIFQASLFWDTDINKINWNTQASGVIERVFQRGTEEEQAEIIRFYGSKKVKESLNSLKTRKPYQIYQNTIRPEDVIL